MKKCTECLQNKEISMFYKDKRRKDGLYSSCKQCHNIYSKKYHSKSSHFLEYQRKWKNNNYKNNLQYKLQLLLRSRLYAVIKNNQKSGSAVNDLGCTLEELKSHLEKQFTKGMNWDNMGKFGWHIDHIKPLCSFNLADRNEFLIACNYKNLQPMWCTDNWKKGGR